MSDMHPLLAALHGQIEDHVIENEFKAAEAVWYAFEQLSEKLTPLLNAAEEHEWENTNAALALDEVGAPKSRRPGEVKFSLAGRIHALTHTHPSPAALDAIMSRKKPEAAEDRGHHSAISCKKCGKLEVYVQEIGDHPDYRITCYACKHSYCVDGSDA